jgi:hypothetical protein
MLALARYPLSSQRRQREDYIHALEECRVSPAYYVILPTGDNWPCSSVPFMPDDSKGWTTVKRKIRVKRIKTDEELDYEATQMHDYWEAESVDSLNYVLPTGEHNGALFDIGARF